MPVPPSSPRRLPAGSLGPVHCGLMPKPDELIVDIAALVESGRSSRMSLTVVTDGAVITGRLAPEAVWRQRVSEVLTGSTDLAEFSAVFDAPAREDGPPTHLHFHVARILQGRWASPRPAACTAWRSRTSVPGPWGISATPTSDRVRAGSWRGKG